MTDQDDRTASQPVEPIGPTDGGEEDTSGHNLGYEYARQQAREKARDVDAWAKREALARQAKKSRFDRLRGR